MIFRPILLKFSLYDCDVNSGSHRRHHSKIVIQLIGEPGIVIIIGAPLLDLCEWEVKLHPCVDESTHKLFVHIWSVKWSRSYSQLLFTPGHSRVVDVLDVDPMLFHQLEGGLRAAFGVSDLFFFMW